MQVSGWNHKLVGHFATPAYQLDPGSQKIKVGNFGAALTGKIPPSGDDLFRDVDCLPLRIVAQGSLPFRARVIAGKSLFPVHLYHQSRAC